MKIKVIGRVIVCVALAFAATTSCKSTETTSAILHNQSGRYDLAIEQATLALRKKPQDPEAHFQLGLAYSQLDSVGLAYDHFTKSAEYDRRNPTRRSMVADNIASNYARHYNSALKQDSPEGRAEEFALSVAADPTQSKAHFQLGRTLDVLGDQVAGSQPDKALALYTGAVEEFDIVLETASPSEKHYVDALSGAGETLAKMGKAEEARSRFSRLVEEDPTSYQVIERIGYARLDAQDWMSAITFLDLAAQARAKISSEDFNLFYNMGVSYFQLGKEDPQYLPKAVEYYSKALNIQPDEPTTVYNVVVVYYVGEDWDQAIAWGERYVGINPTDPKGWRLLGRAYTEAGEGEKARLCNNRYEELLGQ